MKKNLTRVNGLISVIATLVVFGYFELAVIGKQDYFIECDLLGFTNATHVCLLTFHIIDQPATNHKFSERKPGLAHVKSP